MSLPVIILGGGGHAKVLIDALRLSGIEIIGIVDSDPQKKATDVLGVPVVGNDDSVFSYLTDSIYLINGIGSVNRPAMRGELFRRFKAHGFIFASVLHPSAVIAKDVKLAEGVQVMAGAVIQVGSSIGANSIINTKASIDHDCIIGNNVHIAPGATLSGMVQIGNDAHIGTGACIIQGISIGSGSMIAAGAVVTKNVSPASKVRGVPAKEYL
jgi:UDP-perosamine 4-acetyltransferase